MPLQKEIASILQAERHRLVLWVPVCFALGIGLYFGLPREPSLAVAAILPLSAALILYMGRRHFGLRLLALAALLAALGFLTITLRTASIGDPVLRKTLYYRDVEGQVDDIQLKEKGERIILSDVTIEGVKRETGPKRLSISLRESNPDLGIGDRVKVKAMLFPPPGPAMPGSYDFARDFYYDPLGAVGFATKAPAIIAPGQHRGVSLWLNALRLSLANRIASAMGPENGPVAAALMVGEMSGVSEEVKDAMRDSGLYHVLSISGLHMSIAAGLLYGTVRLLLSLFPALALRWPVKKIAAAAGLLGAFAYLVLAGSPVPAVRSFVMVACVMLAVLFDRQGISLYSLAWAALLILIFQPEALFGSSFQLSFAATLGIIALYERFGHVLFKSNIGAIRRVWLYFMGLVTTSLVATLATTPLVIYHFNRFTLWGIVANMLMIPLASFWIMPAAILSFLAMPFGLEQLPLHWLDIGIGWMIAASRWFAALPHAAFSVPPLTFGGFLLVVFGGLWLCLWRARWRIAGIPLMLLGVATIALHQPYDLLVNDDGNKIAQRLPDGRFLFIRGEPDSFEAEVWLKAHGEETGLSLKEVKGTKDEPACDKQRCILSMGGRKIVVAKKKKAEGLCEGSPDIVIAEDFLDREPTCEPVPLLIDRSFLEVAGAVGVRTSSEGVKIDTASSHRGERPWVPRPYSKLYPAPNPAMMPSSPAKDAK